MFSRWLPSYVTTTLQEQNLNQENNDINKEKIISKGILCWCTTKLLELAYSTETITSMENSSLNHYYMILSTDGPGTRGPVTYVCLFRDSGCSRVSWLPTAAKHRWLNQCCQDYIYQTAHTRKSNWLIFDLFCFVFFLIRVGVQNSGDSHWIQLCGVNLVVYNNLDSCNLTFYGAEHGSIRNLKQIRHC